MSTVTVELAERTASGLADVARELDLSISQLIEAIAGQFLADQSPVFALTESQIAEIKHSIDDPRPSIAHEDVMARARRIIAGEK